MTVSPRTRAITPVTSSYIDAPTREAVRSGGFAYLEVDIPPGKTLNEYRRERPCAEGGFRRALRRAGGGIYSIRSAA